MTTPQSDTRPYMDIRQVYLKDVSFESPRAPAIFSGKVAEPKVDVQIRVEHEEPVEHQLIGQRVDLGREDLQALTAQRAGQPVKDARGDVLARC